MNKENNLLRISSIKFQIAKLEDKRKIISFEIDRLSSSTNAMYIHDIGRINELYGEGIKVLDKLFNLEKELYYLQQYI